MSQLRFYPIVCYFVLHIWEFHKGRTCVYFFSNYRAEHEVKLDCKKIQAQLALYFINKSVEDNLYTLKMWHIRLKLWPP